MIDALTFGTEAEAQAAVNALKSKGHRAEWFFSSILKLYIVPI